MASLKHLFTHGQVAGVIRHLLVTPYTGDLSRRGRGRTCQGGRDGNISTSSEKAMTSLSSQCVTCLINTLEYLPPGRMAASDLRPEEATEEPPLTGKAIGLALVGDTLSALGASAMVAPFVR